MTLSVICRLAGHDWHERPVCPRCGEWSPELQAAAAGLIARRDPVAKVLAQNYQASAREADLMEARFSAVLSRRFSRV